MCDSDIPHRPTAAPAARIGGIRLSSERMRRIVADPTLTAGYEST
jgi:hypothetical protein